MRAIICLCGTYRYILRIPFNDTNSVDPPRSRHPQRKIANQWGNAPSNTASFHKASTHNIPTIVAMRICRLQ
jgi:hypothetical protein